MKNKNINLLQSFTEYCTAHPEQRFWQALRNWSGYAFIYGSKREISEDLAFSKVEDTFYFEGKNK